MEDEQDTKSESAGDQVPPVTDEEQDPSVREAARALGKLGAAKGGRARAESLSPERRKEIAQKAIRARWEKEKVEKIPTATFGSPDRPLRIGGVEIPCYVLDDGRRVLHQRAMVTALGMSRGSSGVSGGDRLAKFASGKALEPFIGNKLGAVTEPILFRTKQGAVAYGYEATVLADICEAVLAARKANALQKQQLHIAEQCEILVRGFARVGIIALVDEVTGYQDIRDRLALQEILDKFLVKEVFKAWAKRFPDEFYKEIFRLRGWQWRGMKINRPQVVAHYTKDLVYARLLPRVLAELEERNPKNERGYRKYKHHEWLTGGVGHPALAQHLHAIIGLMRSADTWDEFMKRVDRAFPRQEDTLKTPLFKDED